MGKRVVASTVLELARILGGIDTMGKYSLEYISDDTKKLSAAAKRSGLKLEKVCIGGVNLTAKSYAEFCHADGTIKKDVKPLWGGFGQRLSAALCAHFPSKDETTHTFENADKYYLYIFNPEKEPRVKVTKYMVNGNVVDAKTYWDTFDANVLPSELTKKATRSANQKAGERAPLAVELAHVKKLKRGNVVYTL